MAIQNELNTAISYIRDAIKAGASDKVGGGIIRDVAISLYNLECLVEHIEHKSQES